MLTCDPRAPSESLSRLVLFGPKNPRALSDEMENLVHYTEARYQLGIREVPSEIVRNKSLPLNYNVDLMNGVSFSEGCYLGQVTVLYNHSH